MGAVYNEKLKEKFRLFVWDRHWTVADVARACNGKPSAGTLNNWHRDGKVSEQTVRQFLKFFKELNADEWISLFEEEQNTVAA